MNQNFMELMSNLISEMIENDGDFENESAIIKVSTLGIAFANKENKMKDLMKQDKLSEDKLLRVASMYRTALNELKSILSEDTAKDKVNKNNNDGITITDIDEN